MSPIFWLAAALLFILGMIEAARAISLWWAEDDEARPSRYASAMLLSLALLFVVMARIDG